MDKNIDASLARIKASIEKRAANTNIAADKDPCHELIENSVTKSNALSRAYYRFGLVEKRCMEALISKLNPMRNDNIQEIELLAVDYAKTFNVSEKNAYEHLNSAVDALLNRVISAEEPGKNKPIRVKFTLMAKARYIDDEGYIICVFNPLIVPYLIGLREKFSSYPLNAAVDFSSSYTWRFYELLVSWAQNKQDTGGVFAGWFTPSVDDLRKMLGVPDSYRWVHISDMLENTIKELKVKANIHVNITRIKTSRKITHLKIEYIKMDT